MAPQCGAEGNASELNLEPKMSFVFMVNCCIFKTKVISVLFNSKTRLKRAARFQRVHFCIFKTEIRTEENENLELYLDLIVCSWLGSY